VAHDFNNILTAIIANADLTMLDLDPSHPALANVMEIQKSAERAANLTRQLLAFARRQVVEFRLVDVRELVLNLNKMLLRLIGEDVDLQIQCPHNHLFVKADPGQIEQVLLNLTVNARDAMPEGGILAIRAEPVRLEQPAANVPAGEYVLLSVSDTGVGIPVEVQAHIFEPFFTTKEPGKGTGLGLATCFGIVRQSNGHITFTSEPGKGTTFQVYLPAVNGEVSLAGAAPGLQHLARGTETILLAEDEATLRRTVARFLEGQGYTVLQAANGQEALQLMEDHGPGIDLLLTDVIMPGMGGRALAEQAQARRPGLRILFMSGYISDASLRDTVVKYGSHFLQKLFTTAILAGKLREVISGG
jgi:two-component system, cell cycle sensor histidine kinase and response regulator CckA